MSVSVIIVIIMYANVYSLMHLRRVVLSAGEFLGQHCCIPRITIIPSNSPYPFDLRRRQFPVRPAFVMTINKSQGQSIDKLGVCLPKPCFVHGQLYVAYSRSGHPPAGRNGVRVVVVDSSKHGAIQGQYYCCSIISILICCTHAGDHRVYTRNCVFPNLMRLMDGHTHVVDARRVSTTTVTTTHATIASWAPGFVPPPLTPDLCDCDGVDDCETMTRIGRGRTCRDVAMEMRRMGEELLVLGEDDLGISVDGDRDSDSSESENEMEGMEEVWLEMYRLKRLGGVTVKLGMRKTKMREILGRSCGSFDIEDKNFKLLTTRSKHRSKFA